MKKAILLYTVLILCKVSNAQNISKIKFGDVKEESFKINSPVVTEDDAAVVLSDVGSTHFEGNNRGDFTLIYKRHKRILIKKKTAFDLATVSVRVYKGASFSNEEQFEDFQAATYNLENGQVVQSKIDKSALFTEKYTREINYKKFALTNLKEGSIIEYTYTIKSPYYRYLRSWAFQDKYPVLWSEYQVTIPPMFNYVVLRKGIIQKYTVDSSRTTFQRYSILIPSKTAYESNDIVNISGDAKWGLWALKDIPAFKTEVYTSNPGNYFSKIDFQLHSIKYSDNYTRNIMKPWGEVTKDLLKDEEFGLQLSGESSWVREEVKKSSAGAGGLEAAKKIYTYVRDNYSCNDHDALYTSSTLKKVVQNKTGNVADINLLLTTMLQSQGFKVTPVILSTRDNGFVYESMALLNQYNYVICKLEIDSSVYLLDASNNKLGFGKLPVQCYNGSGRMVADVPYLVPLHTDSLLEEKRTTVFIVNNEQGKIEGAFNSILGYYESLELREKLPELKQDEFFKKIEKSYSAPLKIENYALDSLKQYDFPIGVKYEFTIDFNDEDLVYFTPLFTEAWKENPFKNAERNYPVEMPYTINELYILNMDIPKGYKVDELPKSARVKLNDEDGMFEYLVVANNQSIQLRCKLQINKANFSPDDYETLRNFFGFVVKKEAEQIVFKKVK